MCGELARADPPACLDRAPLPKQPGQGANRVERGERLLAAPTPGERHRDERELGGRERGEEERDQRTGVDADDHRPPVSLEESPLRRPLPELVVVIDARRGLDPERAAEEAQAHREVDVLVIEEELRRKAAGVEPRLAGYRQ